MNDQYYNLLVDYGVVEDMATLNLVLAVAGDTRETYEYILYYLTGGRFFERPDGTIGINIYEED